MDTSTTPPLFTLAPEYRDWRITGYKLRAVSWTVNPDTSINVGSRTEQAFDFTAPEPLEARRAAHTAMMALLRDLCDMETAHRKEAGKGAAPPLAFLLRIYFITHDGKGHCICIRNNCGSPAVTAQDLWCGFDYEAELYHWNGYETGGGVCGIFQPGDPRCYKVLPDYYEQLRAVMADARDGPRPDPRDVMFGSYSNV